MAFNLLNKEQKEKPTGLVINGKPVKNVRIRRLTPIECARLQTIPEWYNWQCSDTTAYKLLGNGWTCEVIKWFFQYLPKEWFKETETTK